MELDSLICKIDTEALKKLIESDTVYESVMLKTAFPGIKIIGMEAVELYRHHFALFNFLYTLQKEYAEDRKYLHVHFMRTGVFGYPPEDKCAYFDEISMSFCESPVADNFHHCPTHSRQLGDDKLESLSLKYFYLDGANFSKLDSVTAESLLNGSWEVLSSEFSLNDAYLAMGLSGHENIRTVKMRFRELCKKHHPDSGGDRDTFMNVNRSYRMIIKWLENSEHISIFSD